MNFPHDNPGNHLKRLTTIQSNKGVTFLTPAAFPGSHCPMHAAAHLANSIQGLSSLVLGMQECAYYSRQVLPGPVGKDGSLHWMYVLDASEVVFGCRNGLQQALIEMNQAGAKVILLIITCIPELIGEDIAALVCELQPQLTARLLPIPAAHFCCNGYPAGLWRTLEALAGLMQPRTLIPHSANLLGLHPTAAAAPLIQALSAAGLTLQRLGPDSSIDEFLTAPASALNIVLSPYMLPLAKRMEQHFGTPFVALHDAYGALEIAAAYAGIAEKLGLDWTDTFTQGANNLRAVEKIASSRLKGLRFFATDASIDPIPLAAYLATLGMEPLLLHIEEFYPEDRQWTQRLHALGYDPWACHRVNPVAEEAVFAALRPDFVLGTVPPSREMTLPHADQLYKMNGPFGYERTIWLLDKILQVLDTPVPLPAGKD
ncbi:Oxidoreductase/nitrogenase component 1 [uncultured Sporomusa sp.]|uniref:Oxidoreductase/nitrogenase component 1 n=1 Tax=uncultured Sporomusa sp. TaxID=307249 RepID=A0A212LYX5_9FIRM|nr:nitrogenase component 1 [uncultured Sporomusa sp.]SCM82706.1 Oxidoreductase/nitrogenase component 1 [uncultured Sporomusa sp.]